MYSCALFIIEPTGPAALALPVQVQMNQTYLLHCRVKLKQLDRASVLSHDYSLAIAQACYSTVQSRSLIRSDLKPPWGQQSYRASRNFHISELYHCPPTMYPCPHPLSASVPERLTHTLTACINYEINVFDDWKPFWKVLFLSVAPSWTLLPDQSQLKRKHCECFACQTHTTVCRMFFRLVFTFSTLCER